MTQKHRDGAEDKVFDNPEMAVADFRFDATVAAAFIRPMAAQVAAGAAAAPAPAASNATIAEG